MDKQGGNSTQFPSSEASKPVKNGSEEIIGEQTGVQSAGFLIQPHEIEGAVATIPAEQTVKPPVEAQNTTYSSELPGELNKPVSANETSTEIPILANDLIKPVEKVAPNLEPSIPKVSITLNNGEAVLEQVQPIQIETNPTTALVVESPKTKIEPVSQKPKEPALPSNPPEIQPQASIKVEPTPPVQPKVPEIPVQVEPTLPVRPIIPETPAQVELSSTGTTINKPDTSKSQNDINNLTSQAPKLEEIIGPTHIAVIKEEKNPIVAPIVPPELPKPIPVSEPKIVENKTPQPIETSIKTPEISQPVKPEAKIEVADKPKSTEIEEGTSFSEITQTGDVVESLKQIRKKINAVPAKVEGGEEEDPQKHISEDLKIYPQKPNIASLTIGKMLGDFKIGEARDITPAMSKLKEEVFGIK